MHINEENIYMIQVKLLGVKFLETIHSGTNITIIRSESS